MKRLLSLSYICILSACMAHASDATSAHVQFDKNSLRIESAILGNAHYSKISTEGLFSGGESGAPMLPVKIIHFSVPYNSEKFNIETRVTGQSRHELPHLPFPNQEPGSTDGRGESITHANPALYTRSTPAPIAEIVGESYSAGINKTVAVAIHPVQYDAMNNAVTFAYDMDIALSWSIQDDISQLTPRPVFPADMSIAEESAEELKRKVVNPAEVERNIAKQSPQKVRRKLPFIGDGPYEYIIVTTRNFKRAFERLAAYRKSAGYTANVVCIEDILSHSQFADGDVVSDLNDDAGKLRSFLSYAYSNFATRHVLLGGQLPIRYGTSFNSSTSPDKLKPEYNIPSDLYFGELNSSWNIDGDLLYGEPHNKMDYESEISIGRITCKTTEDVTNYINKLILYETNPGLGNRHYLIRSYAAIHSDFFDSYNLLIRDKLVKLFTDTTNVYQDKRYPKGTDIITQLNNDNYGFIDLHGHGGPESVTMTYIDTPNLFIEAYAVTSLENETIMEGLYHDIGKHSLDNLRNAIYPNWSYSMSCTTMPFDIYDNGSVTYDISKNFGESYVLGKEYGGVAYVGNTRVGYYTHNEYSPCDNLFGNFLDAILSNNSVFPVTIGTVEALSKIPKNTDHHSKLAHNLLGDPLMRPWTKVPSKASCRRLKTINGEQLYTFTELSKEGYVYTCRDLNDETKITRSCFAQTSHSIGTLTPNVIHGIYGKSNLPILSPLLLQDIQFSSSDHVFAGDVYCGKTNSLGKLGNTIIGKDASLTIESTGTIYIGQNTIIEPKAILITISEHVCLDGIELPSGAKLESHSSTLKISSPIKLEKGVTFKHDTKIPLYLTK